MGSLLKTVERRTVVTVGMKIWKVITETTSILT